MHRICRMRGTGPGMGRLKPMYLYRLRIVSAAPRYYAPTSINRYLEKRGLIASTGRATQPDGRIEYAITPLGREALRVQDGA